MPLMKLDRDYIRWNKAGDAFILSHTNQYFASQVILTFPANFSCLTWCLGFAHLLSSFELRLLYPPAQSLPVFETARDAIAAESGR